MNVSSRLPAVKSLSSILPDGTEGGKEFARIVGLLLLNEARRSGLEFDLFDDASGDYEGLDSFSRKPKSKEVIGYQYKFFPSPLTDSHRQQIRDSLENAWERSENLKLVKWVLVTPDDFKNSSRRKSGGDVAWFDLLRDEYKDRVEIEHIGHSKLLALFLQTPYLCLFYYPSLVLSGYETRKTIEELRCQYDLNMLGRYGRIEFVGMSVYKEEASRRIPLEDIYIPLSVVPERAPEESDETPRVAPTSFLTPGTKTVILGDPGSGKSTLLSFLALVGISESLQRRCRYSGDCRLTIVVTLRRYADELKLRKNLPLLDYIIEVAKADFNILAVDRFFYEYYLETGQAVILFDGLDELPGSGYKAIVRQRIESFTKSYPTNTVIVSSRLVGYEAEARFDESYEHYRVAKLRLDEIKRFISDWYSVRIEDDAEKIRNSEDLIRVIAHSDSESIRALARNPLLLTIVALVHRIDAVLPDQRVILYQKCTETLLNTWYKAKRRDDEAIKGRVERRNRLRIEAIAYWMHRKSLGEQGRSVAPRQELLDFLTEYITRNETVRSGDEVPEDQAEIFIEFIKNSAGLIIEAGDGLYSFIHLTFQEYLCATHLAAFGETGGMRSVWTELKGDLQNPRWREVVRLLVASLRSISAQTFFVDKLLSERSITKGRDTALLLIGLLRDSIEPAEIRAEDIFTRALKVLLLSKNLNDIRTVNSALRTWIAKSELNINQAVRVWDDLFENSDSQSSICLVLIRPALGLPAISNNQVDRLEKLSDPNELALLKSLVFGPAAPVYSIDAIEGLNYVHTLWAVDNPEANASAAIGFCVSLLLNSTRSSRSLLARQVALLSVEGIGPHLDHGMNLVAIALPASDMHPALVKALSNALLVGGHDADVNRSETVFGDILRQYVDGLPKKSAKKFGSYRRLMEQGLSELAGRCGVPDSVLSMREKLRHTKESTRELFILRSAFSDKIKESPSYYWDMLLMSEVFDGLLDSMKICLGINLPVHWRETLRATLKDSVPKAVSRYFSYVEWGLLANRLISSQETDEDVCFAAWLILFDVWILARNGYGENEDSPVSSVIKAAKSVQHPILIFALAARDASINKEATLPVLKALIAKPDPQVKELLSAAGWAALSGRYSSQ